jgi:biotin carboxyl carrier protein
MTVRRYRVTVDGVPFTLDVEETAAGCFSVSVGGQLFEARLDGAGDLPGGFVTPAMPATAAGRVGLRAIAPTTPPATVVTPAPAAPAVGPVVPAERRPAGVIAAPMPGVVLEVRVVRGDVVRRGDPLLVLEAMKMRNTIRAPRDGVVDEVTTEAGRPVGPGEPLLRLADPPR